MQKHFVHVHSFEGFLVDAFLVTVLLRRREDWTSLLWTVCMMMRWEETTRMWATTHGRHLWRLVQWCSQQDMIPSLHRATLLLPIQCRWLQWWTNSRLSCYSNSNSNRWQWWANNSLWILLETRMEPVSTNMAQVCLFKPTILMQALCR